MSKVSNIQLDSVISKRHNFNEKQLGKYSQVTATEDGRYNLNQVGTEILHLIEKPCKVSELCDHFIESYDVDRRSCELDILSFLNELLEEDLISLRRN